MRWRSWDLRCWRWGTCTWRKMSTSCRTYGNSLSRCMCRRILQLHKLSFIFFVLLDWIISSAEFPQKIWVLWATGAVLSQLHSVSFEAKCPFGTDVYFSCPGWFGDTCNTGVRATVFLYCSSRKSVHTLWQEYNRGSTGLSVYSATCYSIIRNKVPSPLYHEKLWVGWISRKKEEVGLGLD